MCLVYLGVNLVAYSGLLRYNSWSTTDRPDISVSYTWEHGDKLLLPWLVADAVTIYLCFGFIKNDDLGEAPEEVSEGEADSPSSEEALA